VEPLTEAYRPGLFSLYGEIFGEGKASRFQERFDRLYGENPYRDENQVSNWIMIHESRVVGHLGVVPIAVKVGEQTLRGSWLCDYMVQDGSRFGKAFLELTARGSESSEFPMGYGMAAHVARIYCKLDWRRHTVAPLLVKPLRINAIPALLRSAKRNDGFGRAAVAAASPLRRLLARRIGPEKRGEDPRQTTPISAEFDDAFEALWEEVRESYPIAVERTQSYLRWRYASAAEPTARIASLKGREGLLGFAVVEKIRWRGIVAGLICELVVPRRNLARTSRLLAAIEDLFRRERVSAIVTEGFPAPIRGVLRGNGFVEGESDGALMTFFDRRKSCSESLLREPENWLLTPGDSDRSLGYVAVPWRES
jgi:hypothetical protein